MKKKGKFLSLLIIFLVLIGCINEDLKEDKIYKSNDIISRENEYINISKDTVKFLFKAPRGSKVNIYTGKTEDDLKKVKEIENYKNNGVKISNLNSNQEYFYKIEVINGDKIYISENLSFYKLSDQSLWDPVDWAKETTFYEIFVRSFYDGNDDEVGDFVGLKEKIPYLKELGIEAIWLMPINESPTYHGYDVVDYYGINDDYGTKEEFIDFLETAHDNGIKVIMDLVVNHSSAKHPWFIEAADGNSKYRDYYRWLDEYESLDEIGPWGQNVWHNASAPDYYYGIFWDQMPDLNLRNPEVRSEMKEIAKYWLDPNGDGDFSDGVDGFRLDAALHIDDKDSEVTHNFWQEFNTSVKNVNPQAFLVGENWTDTNTMAKFYEDLDSSFNFSLAGRFLNMANGNEIDILSEIRSIYDVYGQYTDNIIDSTFLTNHDQDRVGSVLGNNESKKKLAGSLLLTLPGTPFIYYGEELGQLGRKPDDNIREPFDWYASASGPGMTTMEKGGFYNPMAYTEANDGISLEEQDGDPESIFEHYKKLIKIRKENKSLFDISNYNQINTPNMMYGYKVKEENHNLYIIHNLTDISRVITLDQSATELMGGVEVSEDIEISGYDTLILKSTSNDLTVVGSDIEIPKVTMKVTVPESTQEDAQIYISGNINNWTISEDYKLKNIGNNIYEIEIDQKLGSDLIFKFVMGLGTYEDTSSRSGAGFTGDDYNNRIYEYKSESETINLEVTEWVY
ncbi:MAG: alpha-amylase family glycosyl hydrolase [Fusobacteriota bacterium]